jgi:transposase
MGRPYSTDLRDRVQGFIEAGHSRRAASRHFGVSPSFAVKLARRVTVSGSTAPARQGRPPGGGTLQAQLAKIVAWVEAEPDITMPELAARLLTAAGVQAHPASLSRLLSKAGFSFKKNADGLGMRAR